jgi:hypothetical protein
LAAKVRQDSHVHLIAPLPSSHEGPSGQVAIIVPIGFPFGSWILGSSPHQHRPRHRPFSSEYRGSAQSPRRMPPENVISFRYRPDPALSLASGARTVSPSTDGPGTQKLLSPRGVERRGSDLPEYVWYAGGPASLPIRRTTTKPAHNNVNRKKVLTKLATACNAAFIMFCTSSATSSETLQITELTWLISIDINSFAVVWSKSPVVMAMI